ncbi:MAG: PglZ domain-containing protein [Methylococcaceae bacterium]|nr:PglZ domain-containing protein [Methylococcaceae bacterium]
MAVIFILDQFGIDTEDAMLVEASETAINVARKQINQHLEIANPDLLRLRINSHALFKRFSDYEGLTGVLPTQQLLPRVLLAQALKTELPAWLSDEIIINSDLLELAQTSEILETSEVYSATSFEKDLIKRCDAELLSCELQTFINALSRQNQAFLQLLKIEPLQIHFKNHLTLGLALGEEVATLLIDELLKTSSISEFLNTLAYQQHLQQLRGFISEHQLNQALPPKNLPDSLLQALPALPLSEENANGLAEKFISALQAIEHKILHQDIPATVLCECLHDWSPLLNELSELIETNRDLITDELLVKLESFSSEQSQVLLSQLQQRLQSYPLLKSDACVEDVLTWLDGYFDYCRALFLDKQTPEETVTQSFSDWLLSQPVRVSSLPNNWRYCEQQIQAYLKEAYIVVVIMVDALSALNQDSVLAELAGLNHLNLQTQSLFAPLPTLTEVGKLAVLTGLEASAQKGSNQTEVLQNHYQNSLKVVKSWKESSERLDENSELVVFFENRLDERLHDCISFNKHRDDIKPIIKQIKRSIESWRKDAAHLNKEIAFIITADHGMTVTDELYQGKPLGKVKERVFKEASQIDSNQDFVLINNYAVPKKRWRLSSDALLTHGGLTPEEVMIPFITLTSNIPEPIKTPLEVSLNSQSCIKLGDKVWQIELSLISNSEVSNIQLNLAPPFKGKANLDSLRAAKTQVLKIDFSSEQIQEGLTEIELQLTYKRTDKANEENNKLFNVEFPPALLEQDTESNKFNNMF